MIKYKLFQVNHGKGAVDGPILTYFYDMLAIWRYIFSRLDFVLHEESRLLGVVHQHEDEASQPVEAHRDEERSCSRQYHGLYHT